MNISYKKNGLALGRKLNPNEIGGNFEYCEFGL